MTQNSFDVSLWLDTLNKNSYIPSYLLNQLKTHLASPQSDGRDWRHIARVNKTSGEKTFLTEGNFVVTSILSWQAPQS